MINYNNYVREITRFLRTLTIKNKWFAERSRRKYAEQHGVAPEDVSWYRVPYYWDICGLTHIEYPDRHSTVKLDTVSDAYTDDEGDPLELSRELIRERPGILPVLRWPADGMDVLCEQYPDDTDYIKSIVYAVQPPDTADSMARTLEIDLGTIQREYLRANLNPSLVDQAAIQAHADKITAKYSLDDKRALKEMGVETDEAVATPWDNLKLCVLTRAIKADHLELLAYSTLPLEPWERTSLLNSVQQTLSWIRSRWCVDEFTNEENYSPVTWAGVWGALARELHVQRLENARIAPIFWNEDIPIAERESEHLHPVHSYHIREFLASKGLDDYTGVLDRRQSLFLYHNLNWLTAHRGTGKVLNILSDYILEPEQSELRSIMMMSSSSGAEDDCLTMPEFISTSLREDREPTQLLVIKRDGLSRLVERTVDSGLEPVDDDTSIVPKLTNRTGSVTYTQHRTPFLEIDRMPLYEGMEERFLKFAMGTFFHEWGAGGLDNELGSINVELAPDYLGYSVVGTVEDLILLMHYTAAKLNGLAVSGDDAVELPAQFECRNIVPTPTEATAPDPATSSITWIGLDDSPPDAYLTEDDLPIEFSWFKLDESGAATDDTVRIIDALHHTTDGSELWSELLPLKDDGELRYIAEQTTPSNPEHRYSSLNQLMDEVDRRFEVFFELIRSYRNAATPKSQEAIRQLITASTVHYVFEHDSGYDSWDHWLETKNEILSIITVHDNEEQEYATWPALAEFLISKTLRIMTSRWVAQDHLSEYKYDRLIRLFKQLTSYSSCYLDRSQQTKTHWRELQACGMDSQPSGGGTGATVRLSALMTAHIVEPEKEPLES